MYRQQQHLSCCNCRDELFVQPYDSIDWNAARNQCATEDLYYPHSTLQNCLWWTLYQAEAIFRGPLWFLRTCALKEVMTLITYEDENTRYIDIGPVNKTLNMLCCWFDSPEGEAFKRCGHHGCYVEMDTVQILQCACIKRESCAGRRYQHGRTAILRPRWRLQGGQACFLP